MTGTPARLEERIGAAARLLGMQIHLGDGEDWHVASGHLRIGTDYFTNRGHDLDAAITLTLREAWLIAPGTGQDPARSYRRMSIADAHPELEPLLITIDVLHSQRLLLDAMPGHASTLRAATHRDFPEDLRDWSPLAQWLGLLRRSSLGLAATVEAPILDLLTDHVRHALWYRCHADALTVFDQYLSVTLPATLSLMRGGGLTDTHGTGTATDSSEGIDTEAGAASSSEAQSNSTEPHEGGPDSEDPHPDALGEDQAVPAQDAVRRHDESSLREQSGAEELPSVLLDTPLPVRQAYSGAGLPPQPRPESPAAEAPVRVPSAPSAPSAPTLLSGGGGALAEYRHQLQRHRALVDAVRDTWKRYVTEHLRVRRDDTNTSTAIPGRIHSGRLSRTFVEAKAGLPTPPAYRARRLRPIPAPGLGTIDCILILDRSGSMHGPASRVCADAAMVFLEALHFTAADVQDLEIRHRIDPPSVIRSGLIVFDEHPTLIKPLTRGLTDTHRTLMRALTRETGGHTHPAAALTRAEQELTKTRPPGHRHRRIVVCVSDGGFSDTAPGRGQLADRVARMRDSGIDVYGLGIGRGGAHGMAVFAPTTTIIDTVSQLPDALAQFLTSIQTLTASHSRSQR